MNRNLKKRQDASPAWFLYYFTTKPNPITKTSRATIDPTYGIKLINDKAIVVIIIATYMLIDLTFLLINLEITITTIGFAMINSKV